MRARSERRPVASADAFSVYWAVDASDCRIRRAMVSRETRRDADRLRRGVGRSQPLAGALAADPDAVGD